MRYKFHIPEIPKSMQSVSRGKGHFYQDNGKVLYKFLVLEYIKKQIKERYPDFKLIDGCVKVSALYYVFPLRSSYTKAEKQRLGLKMYQLKRTKPDLLDNLSKGFCDALTGTLWKDDSLVVMSGNSGKFYHQNFGTYLIIEEIDEWQETVPAIVENFHGYEEN